MLAPTVHRLFFVACAFVLTAGVSLAQDATALGADVSQSCAVDEVGATINDNLPISSAELDNPSMGFGLSEIVDWSTELPFIDVMKTARTWTGHLPGQWGGWYQAEFAEGGYLDENGWLKAIPPEVTAVELVLLTQLPAGATSTEGRYRLTYEGSGAIEVYSVGQRWTGEKGEVWFYAKPGDNMVSIKISATDPKKTGDYIRNISVVKQENIAAFEAGVKFNPVWLNHIQDARLVRFMDWMQTNNSTQSDWNSRPRLSDYTYTLRGAPLEVMVELANQIGADPWFTMPHLATDHYMECFAKAVHASLRSDLKAHVELSNEVWNWMFMQARWAEEGGVVRWGQAEKWVQFYAVRAMDMARIWDSVYAADADDRLVKVITTHTGWLGLEIDILTPPLWIAENPVENVDAAHLFDAYAITGYFGFSLGDGKADKVREWIATSVQKATEDAVAQGLSGDAQADYVAQHRFDLALEMAGNELNDGSVSGDKSGSLSEFLNEVLPHHAEVARKFDLDLIMYEGGSHVVGIGANVDDQVLADFYVALNYSPQMARLYERLMSAWKTNGGTVFTAYTDIAPPSKWGSWGALRHLDDNNPRWDALVDFNKSNPGWWEERGTGSFLAPN